MSNVNESTTTLESATGSAPDAPLLQRSRRSHFGQRLVESTLAFALGIALMRFVHAGCPDPTGKAFGVPGQDSFFHIKMAEMFPEVGLIDRFPWLQFSWFTDEGDAYVSNHYGFHALLSPFVKLSQALTGDSLAGGRWAMAVCMGLSLVLLNFLLVSQGVPWRGLWLILFVLLPFQYFVRHAYVRAIAPSLLLMLLLTLMMFRRRWALAGIAVLAYTQLYNGGIVYAPVLVVLFVLASVIGLRGERAIPWKLIVWTFSGWLVGMIFHPYRAGMFEFLKVQIFGTGLSPDISVGREWLPYENVWWFAQMSGILLGAWAAALAVRVRFGPPIHASALMLLLAHFFFLALTCKARRFVEYWPMFCLLSTATLAADPLARAVPWFQSRFARSALSAWINALAMPAAVGIVFLVVYYSPPWKLIRQDSRCRYELSTVARVMDFIREDSQPGDIIFADDWDMFPVYFFFNDHNHYVAGLDPKFTHARRPDLWERFVAITRAQTPKSITVKVKDADGSVREERIDIVLSDIRDVFGAKYVIVDHDHRAFAAKLAAEPSLAELAYPCRRYADCRDAPFVVFRLRPATLETPAAGSSGA
jgi:hypothetical protein